MKNSTLLFALWCLFTPAFSSGQTPSVEPATTEPSLPVIDYKACPFEGCTFGKWIVTRDVTLFSTWKEPRTPVTTVKKGQVVTGITGIHITYEPDRIQVLRPIPELHLRRGDVILRYMYRGEGFADIWAKGQLKREYDCSFITEKNNSGCLLDCAAKVISEGRKDWWVQAKTSTGSIGWTKVKDQFDCMDSLGGDPKCDNIGTPKDPAGVPLGGFASGFSWFGFDSSPGPLRVKPFFSSVCDSSSVRKYYAFHSKRVLHRDSI